ncbi:hypothetical protein [Sphingomonas sp. PAMC 26617]|uniref:hypothetical protein n=1 Tax=Sphingomonas sp. PAMC 26617 TaxID=1112216 RepID=UPI0002DFC1A7|nr:hypothetical protein [Sphingomonas sp. PAMC 26617]
MMNATPEVGGSASSSLDAASSPPDEAPMATIGIDSGGPLAATGAVPFSRRGDAG